MRQIDLRPGGGQSGLRVAVLLSGGVDSAVALHLLRRQGHDCTAFYLKVWLEDELSHLGSCPWEEDLAFARAVCAAEGVPLEVLSLQRIYREQVVTAMLAELRAGRTPSPDVWCNRRIKFGAFLEALPSSFDAVASGHYARRRRHREGVELLTAADPVKDQTYFLCLLDQAQLCRCLFPLGELTKTAVRGMAQEAGLAPARRPDSQGVCFLGKVRFEDFVAAYLGERPGEIVDADTGRVLGEHRGVWFHTVGQRKGLGLAGGPWYVVGKEIAADRLLVARESGPSVNRMVRVPEPHWILGSPRGSAVQVKVRHGPRRVNAELQWSGRGELLAHLAEPDRGLAPGQFLVVYEGEVCRGGGAVSAP